MHIINKFGILHSYPDGAPLPSGARPATEKEVSEWQAQDLAAKKVTRQKKREAAQARAQLVVMSGNDADERPEAGDDKPAAKR